MDPHKRHILQTKTVTFRTDMVKVKEVLDHLVDDCIITESMADDIRAERTRGDKARALHKLIQKRGKLAFEGYYKALRLSGNHDLADILEIHIPESNRLSRPPQGSKKTEPQIGIPVQETQKPIDEPDLPEIWPDVTLNPLDVKVTKCHANDSYMNHHFKNERKAYTMVGKKNGVRVLIINNEKFGTNATDTGDHLADRDGTDADVTSLYLLLNKLGLTEVKLEHDLNGPDPQCDGPDVVRDYEAALQKAKATISRLEDEIAALRNSLSLIQGLPKLLERVENLNGELQSQTQTVSVRTVRTSVQESPARVQYVGGQLISPEPQTLKSSTPKKRSLFNYPVDENGKVDLGYDVLVEARNLQFISIGDVKKNTYTVCDVVFTKDELATSSLTGKQSNAFKEVAVKTKLNEEKVQAVLDNKPDLARKLNSILRDNVPDLKNWRHKQLFGGRKEMGRRMREKRPALDDLNADNPPQPTKKKMNAKELQHKESSHILSQLKKCNPGPVFPTQLVLDAECTKCAEQAREIEDLKLQLANLQSENTQLRKNLAAQSELPSIVRQLREFVVTARPPMTIPLESRASLEIDVEDDNLSAPEESHRLSRGILNRCSTVSAQKFINDMLTAMFPLEYLATHTISGTKGSKTHNSTVKPSLEPEDVSFIIEECQKRFPDCKDVDIKACVRLKLNNSSKMMKKRNGAV